MACVCLYDVTKSPSHTRAEKADPVPVGPPFLRSGEKAPMLAASYCFIFCETRQKLNVGGWLVAEIIASGLRFSTKLRIVLIIQATEKVSFGLYY